MTKVLNKDNIDLVIYHANCVDGFGSALAVYMYYKKNPVQRQIEFIPVAHGSYPPQIKNKNVLICDFSYKKDAMKGIIDNCKSLLIIDHHISAQKELENIDKDYKIFDMEHSGAYLTWKYFFGDTNVPMLIRYIEDNDIWKKELPFTEEITCYLSSQQFDMDIYENLLCDNKLKEVIPFGKILLEQKKNSIQKAIHRSYIKFMNVKGTLYFVAVCNSSDFISDVGNKLLGAYEFCDFSVVYTEKDGSCNISFRSSDDRSDVSVIAEKFGGGGHRNASGSSWVGNIESLGKMIAGINLYNNLSNIEFVFNKTYTISDTLMKTGKEYLFNYILLNESCYQSDIGRYLIKTKENGVQRSVSLYRKQTGDMSFDKDFDFAFIWNYSKNRTWFTVTGNVYISMIVYGKIFEKYPNFEKINNDQIRFSLDGFNLNIF
jgi:oligoribonuclease NrnB/cAMP/cGMP phosphodiesterase (DHH superfamily)